VPATYARLAAALIGACAGAAAVIVAILLVHRVLS
jgi:hypothetical protein